MEIIHHNECSELDSIKDAWDRFSEKELSFVPGFSELRHQLEAAGSKFRFLIAIEHSQIIAIACFIYRENAIRGYQIAAKRLFDLRVNEVSLFGSSVLGQPGETVIRKIFELIIEKSDFDLIRVGEIRVDSPLHKAITGLRHGVIAWGERKNHIRWLIRLPRTFDEYVASLRSTTRRAIFRDRRRFESESSEFHVVRFPNEVEAFLRDADKISRLTYQWNLGCGLCNDENTRLQLTRLAQSGSLRCYIVYIQGEPCAFGWGELSHRTFVWHVTGYDPKFHKLSPGTALLMWMIRDLIENTNCEVFDFKWGDEDGYKSRFGTMSFGCRRMHVAQINRPYSFLIVALDQALNLLKNLVENFLYLVFGHGALRQRLRRAMHRWGIATY
jgi:Acetyltransferase (GNAT) domain